MSGMSFTYMINNMGPKMLPCDIPLSTGFHVEELPFIDTQMPSFKKVICMGNNLVGHFQLGSLAS